MPYNFNAFQLVEIKKMMDSVGPTDTYREWFNIPRYIPISEQEVSDFIGDWILQYRERVKDNEKP